MVSIIRVSFRAGGQVVELKLIFTECLPAEINQMFVVGKQKDLSASG